MAVQAGQVVDVLNIYPNYSESNYTLKIRMKDVTSGYITKESLADFTPANESGELASILLSLPYGYEGDLQVLDEDINKYKDFIRKYPQSIYTPEALMKVSLLHFYALREHEAVDKKKTRIDDLHNNYMNLSENLKEAKKRNSAKEIEVFISKNRERLLDSNFVSSEYQHIIKMNESLESFIPKVTSDP